MKTEYEINDGFTKDVDAIVNDKKFVEFNPIREQELAIRAVLIIKTNNEGEHVEPKNPADAVKCVKLSPLHKLLTDFDYLIVGDYYFWTHSDDVKKQAGIHRALMEINVERSKAGEIKLGKRKPTIQEFPATIARFGAYNEGLLDMREALKTSAKQFAESQKPKG